MASVKWDPCQLETVKPRVAVVQMTSTSDREATRAQATALVKRGKAIGADMIFLPEVCDFMPESTEQTLAAAEPLSSSSAIRYYRDLASRLKVWLSLGSVQSVPEDSSERQRVYNTSVVIDEKGEVRGVYNKVHLFNINVAGQVSLQESKYTIPGDTIGPPVDTPVGKLGLAICYDMRFPEMASILREQGAELIMYPSAFTIPTGMAHWDVVLRARAIETQCYVIAAAQIGTHSAKRSSYGSAMVVDPWGTVIAKCHDKPDVCVAEIDLELLHKRRQSMPMFEHKRHDIYSQSSLSTTSTELKQIDSSSVYTFGHCKVPASSVFYHSLRGTYACVNRKPVLEGHVLVIPSRCVKRFAELTAEEVQDLFLSVQHISGVVERHYSASSLTISVQDGRDAGQSVEHVHVHVLPRHRGDFEHNDEVYERLESHDKNVKENEWRTVEDMATEAGILRKLFYQ